eukprot:m.131175 g.131175  ORF g.131175 m.131175 type:complete len:76 (+) comp15902_c0_seq3:1473-1700(+)
MSAEKNNPPPRTMLTASRMSQAPLNELYARKSDAQHQFKTTTGGATSTFFKHQQYADVNRRGGRSTACFIAAHAA